jgi:hypothetical protein
MSRSTSIFESKNLPMVPHMPLLHDMALINLVQERDFRLHPLCPNHSPEKVVETEGAVGREQLISGIVRYKGCMKERVGLDDWSRFS